MVVRWDCMDYAVHGQENSAGARNSLVLGKQYLAASDDAKKTIFQQILL
jgi:hypothetical protein